MGMSSKKTKDLPNIPRVPKEISEAASREELIVFMGAGVSRIIGCPSWKQFAELHLKHLYEEKRLINYHEYINLMTLEPRKILSVCKNILIENGQKPPPSKSFLKADESLKQKHKIYEFLYSMKAIYVTTNYDDHLDEVASNIQAPQTKKGASADQTSTAPVVITKEPRIVYRDDDFLV